MTIKTVGIIGAGTMGNGIAQTCSMVGIPVVMVDISEAALQRGMATINGSLDRLIQREKMSSAEKDATLARIWASTRQADFQPCDFVIEAATESLELKLRLLKHVEEH